MNSNSDIITINESICSINSGMIEFPETPPKPTLCDVVLSSGIRFNDVYLEWNKKSNQIKIFKNVHPVVDAYPAGWYSTPDPQHSETFIQYIEWMGYDHLCTILGTDCAIINKENQLTTIEQILKLSEHLK